MYLYDLLLTCWPILIPVFAMLGIFASVAIPPSSDALDLVQRTMYRSRERMAERAREYQRLRKMELPR